MQSPTGGVQAFGALLRRRRVAAGLSQEALAERAGLSVRGLSDLERGVRNAPYPSTIARLADALSLAADERAALVASARREDPLAAPSPTPVEPRSGTAAGPAAWSVPVLPVALTSFVGREQELAEVRGLLESTRLLSLTGSGGVGKTRLALEVARTSADGPWTPAFVELAPLLEGPSVVTAVASALGVTERPGRAPLDTLAEAIGPRAILLVLDNCEHLVVACAELADRLLRNCPRLRILATSREPLGVVGESIWRVPSLAVPDGTGGAAGPLGATSAAPEPTESFAAIRLFGERTRLVLPGFTLTAGNLAAVVQICRRLDGVPLAIELAAARMAVLSADQIAARLDDRFKLLSGGGRTAPVRQRTLLETVEWSYGLLGDAERRLFDRLSIFAGGWTLEAIEAIMAPQAANESTLDLLSGLVSKSLVLAEPTPAGPFRYRILETLRQYGRDRLEAAGAVEAARRSHAEHYLWLAETAEPELRGPHQDTWLARLELEHDNFRAALAWSRESTNGAEIGLRLAGALGWFWYIHGYSGEGRRQLGPALQHAGHASVTARARALGMAGFLARLQGEPARSWELLEQSECLYRELGDRWGLAFVINGMGMVLRRRGEYARSAALCEEGLALFEAVADRWGIAWSLVHIGEAAAEQGDMKRAGAVLQQALAVARELRNRQISAWSLTNLARIASVQGDYATSVPLAEEGLELFRALGDPRGIAMLLAVLGDAALARGEGEAARAGYEASLHLRLEIGDLGGVAECLERGAIAVLPGAIPPEEPPPGEPGPDALARRAVRWLGAADALRAAANTPVPLIDRAAYDRALGAVRAMLTPDAFEAAWASGRALSVAQAVEEGLARNSAAGRGSLWP
jgi:predicted ATPase/transcriptional regulator with XRE-family HTH domain